MSLEFTFITILIIIFLGYFTKRIGLLEIKDVDILNKIVINIAMPSLVFYSLYTADMGLLPKLGVLPLIGLSTSFIVGFFVYLFFSLKKYNKRKKWSLLTVVMMGNTGFFGFPIILGVFGNSGLIRAIFFDINTTVMFIILNFVLIYIFGGEFKIVVKNILTFPLLWAIILGLIFNLLHIPIGGIALNVLGYLKVLTVPLIMISLGLSIDFSGLKNSLNMVYLTSFVKLIIYPIIAIGILHLIGVNGFEYKIAVIEAAMPSAMLALALSVNYNLDFHLTSDCIFINMLFSLITLPIIMSLI